MGRRLKISHLAHLICELYVRLKVVNRTTGLSFRLPLTQAELADVLGLSVVHMNRIVGDLRKLGAVTWADQSLTIIDWARLQQIAEFDPTYLNMVRDSR